MLAMLTSSASKGERVVVIPFDEPHIAALLCKTRAPEGVFMPAHRVVPFALGPLMEACDQRLPGHQLRSSVATIESMKETYAGLDPSAKAAVSQALRVENVVDLSGVRF